MAEDYGVTLKIAADTSDLDKIPQKVEATRREIAQPVQQTVEVREKRIVEEQGRERPAPAEQAETVKVNVEQPEPVKVKVEQDPDPLKINVSLPDPDEIEAAIPKKDFHVDVQPKLDPSKLQAIPPIKVPVEAEQPKPVKIEAKADKVRVEVEDAEAKKRIEALTSQEGIKRIRVVTEGGELASRQGGKEIFELDVDAEKAKKTIADLKADNRIKFVVDKPEVKPAEVPLKQNPDPLKPKVEQPAPVTIKSRFDGTAIGAGINMLHNLRNVASRAMAAFGLFGLAVNGVMAVVSGVRLLHEWINRAETKAKELREELARTSYANAVAHAAASYDRLTESIAKANKLEKERNDILSARKQVERNLEDAQLEQSKQSEISKLDPSATDYDARRKEIERRYEIKSSDAKAARADEDARANADELYRAAKSKDKDADAIESEYRRQQKIVDTAVENKWQAGMAVRRGEAGSEEKYKEAEKAFEEAAAKADEIRKAMEAARAEAQSIRNHAAETIGGNLAARFANEANKTRIENERKQEEAQTKREKEKENAEKSKRQSDTQADFERRRSNAAEDDAFEDRMRAARRTESDPSATRGVREAAERVQVQMLGEREAEANEALAAAEAELAEELKKDAKDRDERRMARAREDIQNAESTAREARRGREDLEAQIENRRVTEAQDYFGNLSRQIESSRPQNRLTAMGLGSGGPSDSTGREQVSLLKEIAKDFREAISAIRAQNHGDGTAVYAP